MDGGETRRIVERVLAGDVDAYERIVAAYQEDVWRAAARLVYDREATKDLVQETFVRAYVSLGSFTPGTAFDAWLRTIARNLARNRLRDRARAATHLDAYREQMLARGDDRLDEDDRRRCDALKECVAHLPEHNGRLVELHYDRAMPLAEVAETVGKSVEATRQALWRARCALRDCVRKRMATS